MHRRRPEFHIQLQLPFQAVPLDRLLAARPHFLVVRTFVDDRRIRIGDIRDVGRFNYDRDVPLGGNNGAPDVLRTEFVIRHEGILVGTDVVITVRPGVDPTAAIETRFRRQRRPADIISARPPRNPGRRPFISGHPDPTDPAQPQPASVMVGSPTESLVRNPGPASVGINPASFGVRTPVARFLRDARLPDVTVIGCFAPGSVRFELPIKHSIGSSRTGFGARFGSIANRARSCHGGGLLRRRPGSRTLPVGQRFFTRLQSRLVLRETLLFILDAFGGQTFLHLPLHFDSFLFFSLWLLARNKKRQRSDERQNGELLHGVVRQGWFLLIRIKSARRLHTAAQGQINCRAMERRTERPRPG